MRCRVTESYSIDLPLGVKKEVESEDLLSSYWFEGEEFFLQLSSYKQTSGQVVQATHRLRDYLADEGREDLTPITLAVHAPDSAAVTYVDENDQNWLISFWFGQISQYSRRYSQMTNIGQSWILGQAELSNLSKEPWTIDVGIC